MISIFAKRAFLNTNPGNEFISKEKSYRGHGHLQRVSSMIRGDQIADAIGARYNPTSGYENDVCIYVKPHVNTGGDFKFEGRKAYIDIVDGHNLGQLAIKHPEVGVITCSEADYKIMKNSIPNEVVMIPQHNCNYERVRREVTEIKRIGVIGTRDAFPLLPQELKPELEKRGIELVEYSKFFDRGDIINFYMSIDLQIVWRPYKKILSNPLKIVNAMSFGIPTIALDEEAFKEVQGCYLPVRDFGEFLEKLDAIIENRSLYETISQFCIEKSEQYHIDTIGQLYKELDK